MPESTRDRLELLDALLKWYQESGNPEGAREHRAIDLILCDVAMAARQTEETHA